MRFKTYPTAVTNVRGRTVFRATIVARKNKVMHKCNCCWQTLPYAKWKIPQKCRHFHIDWVPARDMRARGVELFPAGRGKGDNPQSQKARKSTDTKIRVWKLFLRVSYYVVIFTNGVPIWCFLLYFFGSPWPFWDPNWPFWDPTGPLWDPNGLF